MRLSQKSSVSEVKLDEQARLLTTFRPGDRVEAKFRGRGRTWYKGTVQRTLSDSRSDIAYDDGDVGEPPFFAGWTFCVVAFTADDP